MEATVAPPGAVLPKAAARGYRWFKELASGNATDTIEIAKREGAGDSYVRRLVKPATVVRWHRQGLRV
ncbi:MAG: hypothetical protein WA005_08290 [Candidatus Binataceae bacterium]